MLSNLSALDNDAIDAILRNGDDEAVNRVIQDWVTRVSPNGYSALESFAVVDSSLQALRNEIYAAVSLYCTHTGFVARRANPSLLDMNAAAALSGRYDLVIGIAQGGISLPILMEMRGQSTAYILSSREGGMSHWFSPIRKKNRPSRAERILVCEDDADTGWTLTRALHKIRVLQPTQVDLCFTKGLSFSGSKAAVSNLNVSRVFSTLEVPLDHFMANIRAVAEAAKAATSNKKRPKVFPPSPCKKF